MLTSPLWLGQATCTDSRVMEPQTASNNHFDIHTKNSNCWNSLMCFDTVNAAHMYSHIPSLKKKKTSIHNHDFETSTTTTSAYQSINSPSQAVPEPQLFKEMRRG